MPNIQGYSNKFGAPLEGRQDPDRTRERWANLLCRRFLAPIGGPSGSFGHCLLLPESATLLPCLPTPSRFDPSSGWTDLIPSSALVDCKVLQCHRAHPAS